MDDKCSTTELVLFDGPQACWEKALTVCLDVRGMYMSFGHVQAMDMASYADAGHCLHVQAMDTASIGCRPVQKVI